MRIKNSVQVQEEEEESDRGRKGDGHLFPKLRP